MTQPTIDYGMAAHQAAIVHLDACIEALFDQTDEMDVPSPASLPFCGCEDCVVREILFAAWPYLRDAALAGLR